MSHTCHAVRCTTPCAPKMLMCAKHWRMVPRENQRTVWATYRPGQEQDKMPSLLYRLNQRLAVAAVAEKEGLHPEADQCPAEAARIGEQIIAEAQAGNPCLGASSRPSCVNSRSG